LFGNLGKNKFYTDKQKILKTMNIIQLGACIGNDDLTKLVCSDGDSIEANIFNSVMVGAKIPVYDTEDRDEIVGYISKKNIMKILNNKDISKAKQFI
jgi:hypothetical protein